MRAFIHYLRVRFAVLPVIDALVLVAAMVLGYQIRLLNEDGLVFSTLRGLVFAALMMLTMTAFGLYSRQQDEPFRLVVQKVVQRKSRISMLFLLRQVQLNSRWLKPLRKLAVWA